MNRVPKSSHLDCYSSADLGGNLISERSTPGMVCLLSRAAISWRSRKQTTVSSTDAENLVANECAKNVIAKWSHQ